MIHLESDQGGIELQERSFQPGDVLNFFSVVSEHIEVAMSSEDFNADEFLDSITKEWNDLPNVPSCANSISQSFRNSSPPPLLRPLTKVDTHILHCCPLHESEALQKKNTVT